MLLYTETIQTMSQKNEPQHVWFIYSNQRYTHTHSSPNMQHKWLCIYYTIGIYTYHMYSKQTRRRRTRMLNQHTRAHDRCIHRTIWWWVTERTHVCVCLRFAVRLHTAVLTHCIHKKCYKKWSTRWVFYSSSYKVIFIICLCSSNC